MSVIYTCDGCGLTAPANTSRDGSPIKPSDWYARTPLIDDKPTREHHACCWKCAEAADAQAERDEGTK